MNRLVTIYMNILHNYMKNLNLYIYIQTCEQSRTILTTIDYIGNGIGMQD